MNIWKNPIYYFGCIHDKGHYLWHPNKGKIYGKYKDYQPWGDYIDGMIFDKSPKKWEQGLIHFLQKDGWTCMYWADYSVDSRPGSHSTFVFKGTLTLDQLLRGAQVQWPDLFKRFKYKLKFQ